MLGQIDIFGNVEGSKMIIYRDYKLVRSGDHILIINPEGYTIKRVYTHSMKMAKKEVDKIIKWRREHDHIQRI